MKNVGNFDSDLILSAVKKSADEGIVILKIDLLKKIGFYSDINDKSGKIVGKSVSDFLGKEAGKRVHPEDKEYSESLVIKAISEGESNGEFRVYPDAKVNDKGELIITENEKMLFLSMKLTLLGGDERFKYLLVMVSDITESKRMEQMTNLAIKTAFALNLAKNYEEILKRILLALIQLSEITGEKIDCAGIYLWKKDGCLEIAKYLGFRTLAFIDLIAKYEPDSIQAQMVRQGEPIYLAYQDSKLLDDPVKRTEGILGVAVIPIPEIGALNLGSHTDSVSGFSNITKKFIETIGAQLGGVITRVQTQEALRKSEENIGLFMNTVRDAVFVIDSLGTVVFANNEAAQMVGVSKEHLGKVNFTQFLMLEEMDAAAKVIKKMFKGEITKNQAQYTLINQETGEKIPGEINSQILEIKGDQGSEKFIVGVARDISDRLENIRIQQELAISLRMAAFGKRGADMAHDFNNILTGIIGGSQVNVLKLHSVKQLLQRILSANLKQKSKLDSQENVGISGEIREQIQEALLKIEVCINMTEQVYETSNKGSGIIESTLGFFKGQKDPKQKINLVEFLPDVISISKASKFHSFVPGLDVDKKLVYVQKNDLQMVVFNMINNAVEATEANHGERKIFIALKLVTLSKSDIPHEFISAEPGEFVEISIIDNGCGMTPDVVEKIFGTLYTHGKEEGTGLGLSTAMGVVKDSNGIIKCDSEKDKGTTMRILLPVVK